MTQVSSALELLIRLRYTLFHGAKIYLFDERRGEDLPTEQASPP